MLRIESASQEFAGPDEFKVSLRVEGVIGREETRELFLALAGRTPVEVDPVRADRVWMGCEHATLGRARFCTDCFEAGVRRAMAVEGGSGDAT